jgi:two-component system, OmpR family, alkaline phosphatase synthesis response regulator PhoP
MESQNRPKIILVEDDATMQAVLGMLLDLEGYKVVVAPNIRVQTDMANFVKSEKPDVVLLDVHLREINGLDLLKELRQDSEFQKTRVVMTSGLDLKEKCLEAGANSFVLKPYMPDELISKLRG